MQIHNESPASIKAKQQIKAQSKNLEGCTIANATQGGGGGGDREQTAIMLPSGIKIWEHMNLAMLEGQPLTEALV